jgi:hypothetical protein
LSHLESNAFAFIFIKRLEATTLDGGVIDKIIISIIKPDKAAALFQLNGLLNPTLGGRAGKSDHF